VQDHRSGLEASPVEKEMISSMMQYDDGAEVWSFGCEAAGLQVVMEC